MKIVNRSSYFLMASVFGLAVGCAKAHAEDAWVRGGWINLRDAADVTAPIRAQLPANTQVQITERKGEWCAVRMPNGLDGYIRCDLLAGAPLTLREAAGNSAKSFWVAPSVAGLIEYGALLRTGEAYNRMYAGLQDGEVAKINALPEFDAAKRLMAEGVVPKVEMEINRGKPIDPESMPYFNAVKPAKIRSSFFKNHGDVVLRSEGNADSLAAVTHSRLSITVLAPPRGYVLRNEGPEISGINGFGDVGEAEVRFAPKILLYSLLSNGLVSAEYLSAQKLASNDGDDSFCGTNYAGTSIGSPISDSSGMLVTTPAKDFPPVPQSVLLMASFVTAKPLPSKKLNIKSRAARITNPQSPENDSASFDSSVAMTISKVVLHEIDIDADGVADMLAWDNTGIDSILGEYYVDRAWYLNINGRWYAAGQTQYGECT
ncbi:MAG: SH3 domain-containing protein [Steroidobacteraceae bacterium]